MKKKKTKKKKNEIKCEQAVDSGNLQLERRVSMWLKMKETALNKMKFIIIDKSNKKIILKIAMSKKHF